MGTGRCEIAEVVSVGSEPRFAGCPVASGAAIGAGRMEGRFSGSVKGTGERTNCMLALSCDPFAMAASGAWLCCPRTTWIGFNLLALAEPIGSGDGVGCDSDECAPAQGADL
jgi:hypothetical protein